MQIGKSRPVGLRFPTSIQDLKNHLQFVVSLLLFAIPEKFKEIDKLELRPVTFKLQNKNSDTD